MKAYATFPAGEEVAACHAHQAVPKPDMVTWLGVKTKYVALGSYPKWAAALTASPATCDWETVEGTAVTSCQAPFSWPAGLVMWTAAGWPAQLVVPRGTPWQYWVVLFIQAVPPTFWKKPVTYACAEALE